MAYEAFENAGVPISKLAGSKTSVYSSCFVTDYTQISAADTMYRSLHESTGHSSALVSNRVSWFFDLRGPSMTIDTGCSGSTVAFHLACESLRSGEAEAALACGVNLMLAPDPFIGMTAFNFVGEDGLSYSFDHRAQGYSRGEGFAAVMLKPLDAALRDNDTIRAIVRSSSVAQDGRTPGLTLPSRQAQAALIRQTYNKAALGLDDTGFFEAHGTGTIAGDAAELGAIGDVFASSRHEKLLVGSAKTNIGHLEGCAGLAGIIKSILAVERGFVPANLNFEKPRPENDLEKYKIEIPTRLTPWPSSNIRRASVNCFGFGGTIAHIILDEPPRAVDRRAWVTTTPKLLVWSAPEQDAVSRNMLATQEYISSSDTPDLEDLAYTLADRRSQFAWRSYAVSNTIEEAKGFLGTTLTKATQALPSLNTTFVFTGQGASWTGMGRELLQYQVFHNHVYEADAFVRSLGADWSVMEAFEGKYLATCVEEPETSQTMCTVLQTGLVDLLRHFGVEAVSVVGHSSGEIAAAYCAGAISRQDAWKLAYFRGRSCASAPPGAMLAVGLSPEQVKEHIASLELEDRLEVACYNSASNLTVSGDPTAVEALQTTLNSIGVFNRKLRVSVAYHSKQMAKCYHEYLATIEGITSSSNGLKCRMFSSVSGIEISAPQLDCSYFVRNLTSPVRFRSALEAGLKSSFPDFLVEIGPHALLQSAIKEVISNSGFAMPTYASMLMRNQDGALTALEALGRIWSRGGNVDLSRINDPNSRGGRKCLSDLPPYVWNHTRSYWFESQRMKARRDREFGRHDLLGEADIGWNHLDMRWRNVISPKELPWILDHKMQGVTLYPAAGMLVMVIEAARQFVPEQDAVGGFELRDVRIGRAMVIPGTGPGLETSLSIKPRAIGVDEYDFSLISRTTEDLWQENCKGSLRIVRDSRSDLVEATRPSLDRRDTPAEVIEAARADQRSAVRKMYQKAASFGMSWGPTFQNLFDVQQTSQGCEFKIRIPDTADVMPAKYEHAHLIHPATLDAMLHSVVFTGPLTGAPKIPDAIDSVFISNSLPRVRDDVFSGRTHAKEAGMRSMIGNIEIRAASSMEPAVLVRGLHCTEFDSSQQTEDSSSLAKCTTTVWKEDIGLLDPEDLSRHVDADVPRLLDLAGHRNPYMKVLHITDGNLNSTRKCLNALEGSRSLTPRFASYNIAGITAEITAMARKEISGSEAPITFSVLPEAGAFSKSFSNETFDVVVVPGNICGSPESTTTDLEKVLKQDGILINLGDRGSKMDIIRKPIPTSNLPRGELVVVRPNAVSSFDTILRDLSNRLEPLFKMQVQTLADASSIGVDDKYVLVLLDTDKFGVSAYSADEFYQLKSILQRNKKLLWLTQGATGTCVNPGAASLLGMLRALRYEDSTFHWYTFDLPVDIQVDRSANNIAKVLDAITENEDYAQEYEFAERDGKILIPRLLPDEPAIQAVLPKADVKVSLESFTDPKQHLKAAVDIPGKSESLYFDDVTETTGLGADEVEIQLLVHAVHQLDVLTILGETDHQSLGCSFAGLVIDVGSGVTSLKPGTRVAGFQLGSLQSRLRILSNMVNIVPESMSLQSAASIALDYTSAFHALMDVARLQPSETCLIVDATSATGQAAVKIARHFGAEVHAAIDKSIDLESARKVLDLPSDHILVGRGASEISRDRTQCYDVILCPERITTVSVYSQRIADFGRLVQIIDGRNVEEMWSAQLPRNQNAAYLAVNMHMLQQKKPATCARAFRKTWALLESGAIGLPSSAMSLPHSKIAEAYKLVQESPSSQCIVLKAEYGDRVPVKVADPYPLHRYLHPDCTYLLVGGLGGLGRSIASFLVSHGAKHVAFLSRSGSQDESSHEFFAALTKQGAITAKAVACDISNREELERALSTDLHDFPPIKGVIHGAMVLRDSLFENMSHEDFQAALRPKIQGSWNLHELLPKELDFFIMLSSIAGTGGMKGQANYAAGNSFQDAFAFYRRDLGLAATAIDLTAVLGVGVVAENPELLEGLKQAGVLTMQEEELHRIIKIAITGHSSETVPTPAQMVVGVASGGYLDRKQIQDAMWSSDNRFRYTMKLGKEVGSLAANDVAVKLTVALSTAKTFEEATAFVLEALISRLAKALGITGEDIETSRCVSDYGVDSLLAVDLRNWIQRQANATVSVFELMNPTPIRDLAKKIAGESGFVREHLKARFRSEDNQ